MDEVRNHRVDLMEVVEKLIQHGSSIPTQDDDDGGPKGGSIH